MLAIQNVTTGEYVYGTDYRYSPPHQRTSFRRMLTYATVEDAIIDYRRRKCGKAYRVVVLKTIHVKRVIEPKDGEYRLRGINDI